MGHKMFIFNDLVKTTQTVINIVYIMSFLLRKNIITCMHRMSTKRFVCTEKNLKCTPSFSENKAKNLCISQAVSEGTSCGTVC